MLMRNHPELVEKLAEYNVALSTWAGQEFTVEGAALQLRAMPTMRIDEIQTKNLRPGKIASFAISGDFLRYPDQTYETSVDIRNNRTGKWHSPLWTFHTPDGEHVVGVFRVPDSWRLGDEISLELGHSQLASFSPVIVGGSVRRWWASTAVELWVPLPGGNQQFTVTLPRAGTTTELVQVVNTTGRDLQVPSGSGGEPVTWRNGTALEDDRYRDVLLDRPLVIWGYTLGKALSPPVTVSYEVQKRS